MENQSKKMVQIVYDALDEKLGEDIEILKVDEISIIADYLVIANGRNQNQLNAIKARELRGIKILPGF